MTLAMGLTSCKSKAEATVQQPVKMIEEKTPSHIMINDIWALQSMEGSDYNPKDTGKGLQIPTLEFQVKEKRFGGNDGCNSVFGAIETLTLTELKLSGIGVTRKMCMDDVVSPVFHKNLGLVAKYKIEKTTLFLLDEKGNALMTFRKVD